MEFEYARGLSAAGIALSEAFLQGCYRFDWTACWNMRHSDQQLTTLESQLSGSL